jgi:hypothetical protein
VIAAAVLSASLILTPTPTEAPPLPVLTASRGDAVMTGAKAPYRGKYWRKHQRQYTLCVLRRESNNHWYSTNRSGGYFGGFQFSQALTWGATYMMTPELQRLYGKRVGKQIAANLRMTEMHKWLPFFQHMAFATVLNWEHSGSGKSHWAGGRWGCSL